MTRRMPYWWKRVASRLFLRRRGCSVARNNNNESPKWNSSLLYNLISFFRQIISFKIGQTLILLYQHVIKTAVVVISDENNLIIFRNVIIVISRKDTMTSWSICYWDTTAAWNKLKSCNNVTNLNRFLLANWSHIVWNNKSRNVLKP